MQNNGPKPLKQPEKAIVIHTPGVRYNTTNPDAQARLEDGHVRYAAESARYVEHRRSCLAVGEKRACWLPDKGKCKYNS